MKGRYSTVALAVGSLLLACIAPHGNVSAAFSILLTVAQPMNEQVAGHYRISYVTYQETGDWGAAGSEINLTDNLGLVMEVIPGADSVAKVNRNEANLWGLHIWAERTDFEDLDVEIDSAAAVEEGEPYPTRYFVDTLNVTIDVSGGLDEIERRSDCSEYFAEAIRPGSDASPDEVARYDESVRRCEERRREMYREQLESLLEATLACILDNASRSSAPINHIRLLVRGPEQFAWLGGVYEVPAEVRAEKTFDY
jgi:hypothetical protein